MQQLVVLVLGGQGVVAVSDLPQSAQAFTGVGNQGSDPACPFPDGFFFLSPVVSKGFHRLAVAHHSERFQVVTIVVGIGQVVGFCLGRLPADGLGDAGHAPARVKGVCVFPLRENY